LLYITQTAAIQNYLSNNQTVTATHDQVLSWAGIGSALSTLYSQLAIPATISGTLCVAGYLTAISLLHITTPALFSVQIFNNTILEDVETLGLPEWNTSDTKWVGIHILHLR
jgi:hypothetical protein